MAEKILVCTSAGTGNRYPRTPRDLTAGKVEGRWNWMEAAEY